jgi:hypothetical protein
MGTSLPVCRSQIPSSNEPNGVLCRSGIMCEQRPYALRLCNYLAFFFYEWHRSIT